MKFVAVTSCPTGIAHTYMAAEALEQAGKAAGHVVTVETQGSAGTDMIDDATIAAADGVIFAADLEVKGRERFAGKPTVDVGVKRGVHEAAKVIEEAVAAVGVGCLRVLLRLRRLRLVRRRRLMRMRVWVPGSVSG